MSRIRNAKGEELEPGKWYSFGGNVSFRYTGEHRHTLYMRCDKTGKICKPSGPASRDALSSALYNSEVPGAYAQYCFGNDFEQGDAKLSRFY